MEIFHLFILFIYSIYYIFQHIFLCFALGLTLTVFRGYFWVCTEESSLLADSRDKMECWRSNLGGLAACKSKPYLLYYISCPLQKSYGHIMFIGVLDFELPQRKLMPVTQSTRKEVHSAV